MLILAELLTQLAGFKITFLNNEHNHRRIDKSAASRRRINFISIPDGLPPDHPRTGSSVVDLFFTISTASEPYLKNLIASMSQLPTCIISDGIMSFAIDLAAELGIPAITFRTYSATCTWTYFHLQKLIQNGEIPVLEADGDMDKLISCSIPGLENFMRRRDLPHICRLEPENKNSNPQFFVTSSPFFPTIYAIGPLHTVLKYNTIDTTTEPYNSSGLIKTDNSGLEWLDSQKPNSVLYVSFGSVISLSREQLMEFWYGLVNTGKLFLWAIRPDLVCDENESGQVPEELKMGTRERGRIAGWVAQEEVLAHNAVGGFLTHNGWNSTLESISFGKPMICWPRIADQQVNSMCVSEMWKLGFDMKEICDRSTVEKLVRDLMEGRSEEIVKSTDEIARLAQGSVRDGGSSNRNIKKLIEDIKLLHSTNGASRRSS
ncbi:hypothetical protein RD792_013986 [Penstemon davidsonii]|uniref:Glycosyltransferase n=1 Tax=Penstemon davidsonii TaxID=160366 RepID=A0ABR0CN87_9LAMI|nr:hypothetical protein RD792_013986 [Penstemon davidsonii]